MNRDITFIDKAGLTDYNAMFEEQHSRWDAVRTGNAPDTVYLLQHAPVITLGRNAHAENLLHTEAYYAHEGIALVEADRGGDVTYHGPGQLVAYPILDLRRWRQSVGWYLRCLEQVILDVLAEYGVQGERVEGFTGVWVGDAKVAAIGVGVRRWVTYHGIALNIDPDKTHFESIIPCGLAGKSITSLHELLGETPAFDDVAHTFKNCFLNRFDG